MKSYWHLLLIGTGVVLIVISGVYNVIFAGIPYQDPPPELAARYAFHSSIANAIFLLGGAFFLAGAIAGIVSFALRRRR